MNTRFLRYGVPGIILLELHATKPISTTVLVVLYACVCSFSQQRQQGCDISLRGSSSRARFCTDVEARMGRGE